MVKNVRPSLFGAAILVCCFDYLLCSRVRGSLFVMVFLRKPNIRLITLLSAQFRFSEPGFELMKPRRTRRSNQAVL